MVEVKQGRLNSLLGAVFGFAFAAIGIAVAISTIHQKAGLVPIVFGLAFAVIGLAVAFAGLFSGLSKNRPDTFDITNDKTEPDPLNKELGSH